MKLQLVGPSNTSYSLAAAAQQSLNCYLETIENGGDGKNKYVLRGRPGIRLFKNLTAIDAAAHPVRGLFSGGGRLWVAAGTKFFEIDITGALVGSKSTIANDNYPVDILPNGTQLAVVSGGVSYYDDGSVLTANTLPALSGVATSNGTLLIANSGDTFDIGMAGQTITFNGVGYTVAGLVNPSLAVLGSSAGVQALKAWSCAPVMTAGRLAFMDGYFVINRPFSRQFNTSALMDGGSWSQLDYDYKEGYPDAIVAPWSEPPLLYMLGVETCQMYRNTGKSGGTPFEPIEGGFSRTGLASAWSPVSIMGKLHMLAGGSRGQTVVVRMEGATPVRISTHAVEQSLSGIAGVAITGYSYIEGGHWFWVLHVFGAGNAWVYDATESQTQGSPQWHERAQWDGAAFQPYLPQFHTFIPEWATGTHIVGDWQSGKLYHLDSGFFDDDVTDIRCVRALPYVYSDGKRIYHHRLDFELETGTAGTPPVVTLDWSDDKGQTWGTGAGVGTVRTLGPGVAGTYTTRYYAVGLGSSRGRVYRLTIQGQGKVALIDAELDAEVGSS